MHKEDYKLIAPDVNQLVHCYSHAIQNPEQPSAALMEVLNPLFKTMEDLAPFKKNDEAKGIWVMVPRGEITDWRTYEEAQDYEEVESQTEYEELWHEHYPFEMEWYFVVISENKPDSGWQFKGLSVASREDSPFLSQIFRRWHSLTDEWKRRSASSIIHCQWIIWFRSNHSHTLISRL